MPRSKKTSPAGPGLFEVPTLTAPAVSAIREALTQWRADKYPGLTDTTRALLNFWFHTDHRLPNRRAFMYHYFQREAIETLIYLWEVAGVRRQKDLLEKFAPKAKDPRLLQYDHFARYAVKMATGSGKTKVMALAFAWQYFNAVAEGAATGRDDFARTTLLIAPNIIVFERLRSDFAGGRIYKTDPIIPPELKIYWDVEFYIRGDPERAASQGAFYLTNVDQLHADDAAGAGGESDEPDVMTAVLGPKPPAQPAPIEDFDKRIIKRGGPCLVINDEAHHTHDEDSAWNSAVRRLHAALTTRHAEPRSGEASRPEGETLRFAQGDNGGLAAQLDFTATPRHQKGGLFSWTVFDYPLKQAIMDNVVKRPVKGITRDIQEAKSTVASTKYKAFLTAGVERWKEYREQLTPLGKKPILFVMMNDTTDADDVGEYLQKRYPAEFGGERLLVIHTDRAGEVSKKDLDKARKVAHDVDLAESPVNAIVSVIMLREGWDVQNVTVVVGLRPYTSKANILPEQTIGRGLRLMFRGTAVGATATYIERVDIIGNKAFISFVEDLEKQEDLKLDTFEVGKDKLNIVTIAPLATRAASDIRLPVLSPLLARKKSITEEIAALDVGRLRADLPRKQDAQTLQKFRYEGFDLLTLEKLIEREYTLPEPQTAQEVISYYAKHIAQDVKLPGHFAAIAPKVRAYLETRAFGETVDLEDPAIIKAISTNVAHYVTVNEFARALHPLVVEQLTPTLTSEGRALSECEPFPWSRPTYNAPKSVFNLVPCDNEFERDFAKFLEDAGDVARFAKLPESFGFAIEYTDSAGNLRYYYPDFTAVLTNGDHYLVETKGQETVDVAHKDRAALYWAENATRLTGTPWRYIKVPQKAYGQLQPTEFGDLVVFTSQPDLFRQ